jgi:hypothetical protein
VDTEIEPERADRLRALGQHHHLAAVIVIGGIAGQCQQRDRRRELRQPDQPQAERTARLCVDEPAECDGLNLHRQHDAHPRNDETEQVRLRVDRGRCHLAWERSSPFAAMVVHVVAVIFGLPRLRRKRANGENVWNALPRDADACMLCNHSRSKNGVASLAYVPVNGTADSAESTNNHKRTRWPKAAW